MPEWWTVLAPRGPEPVLRGRRVVSFVAGFSPLALEKKKKDRLDRKRVDHLSYIITQRVEDRAGASRFDVLADLCAALIGSTGRCDELHHVIRHELHRFANLALLGGPGQNSANAVQQILIDTTCLHDVRLLSEILGYQLARVVDCSGSIRIERTDYQLRTIHASKLPPGTSAADLQMLHRLAIVRRGHEVVQQYPVRDFTGQLHHFHSGCSDVDRDLFWASIAVDDVYLDVIHVYKLALERDLLHSKQVAYDFDCLSHRYQRFSPADTNLGGQRFPPHAQPAHKTSGSELIES